MSTGREHFAVAVHYPVIHLPLDPGPIPERRLSRTRALFRELLRAARDGCRGDDNVSGKFEPSAQFPHLFFNFRTCSKVRFRCPVMNIETALSEAN